ncbi:axial regulator YABBY 4 isoform X2 [Benincasa hispida]|uniref:axial regulator YABBY 4 isoform X2 n=1 Tax=Benincasa hispida TaxID=102211 RepID=UPI001902AA7C|nr:axial regulator YABBY 4 isoform X2 [Benincasa hispida]
MNNLFELPEKICYVQCGICTTILLVSVPCSSLSTAVTVTCGHCSSLLSVNMMKANLVPLHFLSSLSCNVPKEACREMNSGKFFDSFKRSKLKFSEYEVEEGLIPVTPPFVNKPPEKRQRAPSAYNCFIKDEIRRLKAQNPEMTHKEAFRTAAKNWANFPPIHEKEDTMGCNEENGTWNTQIPEVHKDGKCFPRHSFLT